MQLGRLAGAGAIGGGLAIAFAPETLGLSLLIGALIGGGVDLGAQSSESNTTGQQTLDNLEVLAALAISGAIVYYYIKRKT